MGLPCFGSDRASSSKRLRPVKERHSTPEAMASSALETTREAEGKLLPRGSKTIEAVLAEAEARAARIE
jgi:hypothetical protein